MRALHKESVLEGKTVLLRGLLPEDITSDYVDWMNDPEVVRFTESRFQQHTADSIGAFVETCNRDPDVLLLGIFDRGSGLHLGNIKLGPVDRHHLVADLGIIIGRKQFWGRGVACESIVLLRDHAFAFEGLHKLTAGCYATNAGSAKAFEKAGFSLEARLPEQYQSGGSWVDGLRFGCLNRSVNNLIPSA
jgi:ribosomal-protein-alanine N-acetyltransferase